MDADRQGACARNNALWCDAVLKAAGATTHMKAGFWYTDGPLLPLYPGAITLSPNPGPDFYAAIKALPPDAAVKDSFDCLDLASMGYRRLFSGTWLFRPARAGRKPPASFSRQTVTHADGLKTWLTAWNENEKLHKVFPAKLLEKASIEFAAIKGKDGFKAGAVLNSGPKFDGKDILGLSNVFCRKSWLYSALHDLLEPFPHRPVCTYEADDDVLPVYLETGFERCGRLSVWLKNNTNDR